MPERILLADDDPSLLRVTEKQLTDAGFEVVTAGDGLDALASFDEGGVDLVLTDVQMPGMDGLELLAEIKRRDVTAAVVVITAHGTVERAVEAMKTGAFDFLEKPFSRERLLAAVSRALDYRSLATENLRLRSELSDRFSFDSIVGGSAAMKEVFRSLGRIAGTDAAVLLTGESGTGKELVARAIHHHGARAAGPFVALNCAAIPESLLESELFGHERGAFTGATAARPGRFAEADGGTLLLDEIGEMHPDLQAKLLRVLQDGEVRPVGATENRQTDARVIASTNRDLDAAIAAGAFREDLYYRIAVVTIEVPPLRARRDDIPLLANHFLGKLGGADVTIAADFLSALRGYRWPGNVRELENVIQRALVLRRDPGELAAEDLPDRVRAGSPGDGDDVVGLPEEGITLAAVEKSLIRQALARTDGNRSRAARLLGITRQTLLYRLDKHGLKDV
ncbi:MAG: sigma-54 dependent transcriptional regulator [Planctomycetota bacterium]